MPENPGLYLRLTVIENLELFAGLYGLRHAGPRIDAALEAVNLGARGRDLCGSLSKGLRQRVGLARALLSDPAIMFLDEPTSGLDPVAAREVHDLINDLRQRGVTVFLTTHRLEEAERLCDRVAILNTRLRSVGRTDELRENLFSRSLAVETAAPLAAPDGVFDGATGVESWRAMALQLRAERHRSEGRRAGGHPRPGRRRSRRALHRRVPALPGGRLPGADRRGPGGGSAMRLDAGRILAVVRKEFRALRRNRFIIGTMTVLPIVFLISPMIEIFRLSPGIPEAGAARWARRSSSC